MENSFGSFLMQNRKQKGLTQKELAKMLFVSESTISKWEKDVSHPDITLLPKLSEILGVSEHELITASIDNQTRQEKIQARKWRAFSFSWSLFFYISYSVALIPCFICNLAINKTLSWFWIVLSALLLAFTFTNLPKLIKKHKLIFIPLSNYLALILLLGVCCAYTKGNWFFITALSITLGVFMIFAPIYISRYKIFSCIKKYNDFVTVGISFLILNLLLIVINAYALKNGFATYWWYFKLALPIVAGTYLTLNLYLSVRFLKVNKFIKTGIILFLTNLLYTIPIFLKVKNPSVQKEIDQANILKADFSCWVAEVSLENNIHLIIFLTVLALATIFLVVGIIRQLKKLNSRKT